MVEEIILKQAQSISIRALKSLNSVLKVLISLNRVLISLKFLNFPPFNILTVVLIYILMSQPNSSIPLGLESKEVANNNDEPSKPQ
jgi:hypothetical protein